MHKILQKKKVSKDIYLMRISSPEIAQKIKPGQYLSLKLDENSEPSAVTVADFDKKTLTLVFKEDDDSKKQLAKLKKGDDLPYIIGPLGNPVEIKQYGHICIVGEDEGIGSMLCL